MSEFRIAIPPMDGELSYPRKNGEPTFAAPWQSRAFGMVVDLHVRGVFPWDEFKQRLIAEIAAASVKYGTADESGYYNQWVDASFRLLVERGILTAQEIGRRIEDFRTGVREDVF
ncbi:nitrile hydratase accessory protein [Paraburkholderia sp. BL6669N2]|uniref:nitrile hydratase accessory protein n=1 Tax=Paraburkholderia sp. BL6669N2 TaxID=1938807 RepID=UPI000E22AFD0|nr:nitrile hydratase accessory protein [Paraburkholderia sp. BL6669N2]REG49617.1 nitrile hydratase accessory protein [Paraburkholderia sp. BL6669N2]